jgi:superfamily I DNA/RNA helicase
LAIDTTRPPKTLRTSHPAGAPVTLGHCADENEEALCIAEEIKRLKMTSGGLLKWSDFSILRKQLPMLYSYADGKYHSEIQRAIS